MKLRLAALLAAAVLAAPLAVPAADPIKVGVNLELSGVSSTWGQPQLNSIQMYVDEANAHGGIGGRRIELEVLDNKSDPAQSRLNATKLAGDGVVAILGAGTTPTTMPAVPVANESGVPMISNGAGNVITNPVDQRRWVFKTPNDDSQVANKIAGFLAKQRLTEVAFLSVNTAYGDSGKTNFGTQAGRFGLKLIDEEKYGPSDTDVTAQLTKIRDSRAQAVVIWGQPPAVTIIAKNAAQLGLKAKLVYQTARPARRSSGPARTSPAPTSPRPRSPWSASSRATTRSAASCRSTAMSTSAASTPSPTGSRRSAPTASGCCCRPCAAAEPTARRSATRSSRRSGASPRTAGATPSRRPTTRDSPRATS